MAEQHRMIVHMASYGSGKTELSLNEVVELQAAGKKALLVDLDVVNPYFRSGEQAKWLREQGIRVIMPVYENTTVDVPALPAEVKSVFDEKDAYAVLDAGGDPVGAAALGRYSREIRQVGAWVRCVVNACRPFTGTPEDIVQMAEQLMGRSRLDIHSLVNNTHLSQETTAEMVARGYETVSAAARILGVGVEFSSAMEPVAERARELGVPDVRVIRIYTRPDWLYGG